VISNSARDSLSHLKCGRQLGAVEHQFTEQPEVHVISSVEPNAFRHELWNCTMNAEYQTGAALNLRCLAINANGKAYEVDRILKLNP